MDDARQAIRDRMESEHAQVAVSWSDGRADLYEIESDYQFTSGTLIARTADGRQLVISPATEWVLLDPTI